MSATTQSPASKQPRPGKGTGTAPGDGRTGAPARPAELVSWKAGVGLGLLAILGTVLFGFLANPKSAGFRIAEARDPNASSAAAWITLAVALAAAAYVGYACFLTVQRRRTPGWLGGTFAVVFLVGFMIWIVAGGRDPEPSISLGGLMAGAVTLAVPLVFG